MVEIINPARQFLNRIFIARLRTSQQVNLTTDQRVIKVNRSFDQFVFDFDFRLNDDITIFVDGRFKRRNARARAKTSKKAERVERGRGRGRGTSALLGNLLSD